MKLTALMKCWRGEEFIDAALASVYELVDRIVIVHSETSWLGEPGNTCRVPVEQWIEQHDKDHKIEVLNVPIATTQLGQYGYALPCFENHDGWVMALDSDEVWDHCQLAAAKQIIQDDELAGRFEVMAYRTQMETYLKTPFFRISPRYGRPTVFVRDPALLADSPRACKVKAQHMNGVYFHHFTYVRKDFETVWDKINTSATGDGGEKIDLNWKERVWDRLPGGTELHAFPRWKHVWDACEKVWFDQLPAHLRRSQGMKHFIPHSLIMHSEQDTLYAVCKGKQLCVELGTFTGASAAIMSLGAEQVFSCDFFEDVHEESFIDHDGYVQLHKTHEHTLDGVKQSLRWYNNITIEKSDSADYAEKFNDNSVDVLFIDADHSFDGTMRNAVAWYPKVKRNGVLLFHDNNDIHPGVQRAISQLPHVMPLDIHPLPGGYASLFAFRKTLA